MFLQSLLSGPSPENGQFKATSQVLFSTKKFGAGNRCNFSVTVFWNCTSGAWSRASLQVYGEHLYQSKNEGSYSPFGKKKPKKYIKAILKILRQGLYNCTPLQAWIKLRVFCYLYVALIPVVRPAAKFSTEESSESPQFSTEGLVTCHLHDISHGQ